VGGISPKSSSVHAAAGLRSIGRSFEKKAGQTGKKETSICDSVSTFRSGCFFKGGTAELFVPIKHQGLGKDRAQADEGERESFESESDTIDRQEASFRKGGGTEEARPNSNSFIVNGQLQEGEFGKNKDI